MADDPQPRRTLRARLSRLALLSLGPLVLLAVGAYWYAVSGRYVSTENAYLKSDKIAISTDVSGLVAEVTVAENQIVEPGQLLFRIDDERFRIALARREAELQAARQEVQALRALHRQKQAELESARAEIVFYESEFKRAERLSKQGHVSNANYDKSRRDLMMARHQVEAIGQDIQGVLANLAGDPDGPVDEHPMVKEALTEREQAGLDLARTRALAPVRAVVSNISLQPGEYVEAGDPVFSLVDIDRVWIEANLKETELTHVLVGQAARISVDAYPDHDWRARVSSIAPATGAEFSLLPPQNASGNWVKVVQRVPVRLVIERGPGDPPLRAGMSVEVEIDTKVERSLPGPIGSALAWIRGER